MENKFCDAYYYHTSGEMGNGVSRKSKKKKVLVQVVVPMEWVMSVNFS